MKPNEKEIARNFLWYTYHKCNIPQFERDDIIEKTLIYMEQMIKQARRQSSEIVEQAAKNKAIDSL